MEQRRIHETGFKMVKTPFCTRVYNPMNHSFGINMSRSIGDFMFKMNLYDSEADSSNYALSNEASILELTLSNDENSTELILMGCDGIWDGTISSCPPQLPSGHTSTQGSQIE